MEEIYEKYKIQIKKVKILWKIVIENLCESPNVVIKWNLKKDQTLQDTMTIFFNDEKMEFPTKYGLKLDCIRHLVVPFLQLHGHSLIISEGTSKDPVQLELAATPPSCCPISPPAFIGSLYSSGFFDYQHPSLAHIRFYVWPSNP